MREPRLHRILTMVSETGHVSVAEVGGRLAVSAATARRDLDELARQKLVIRTHGGASALTSGYELPLHAKTGINAGAKAAIAAAAGALVRVGEVVGMNGGTTTTQVARALARRDELSPADGRRGFTVVTNALNIAWDMTVRPQARVVVVGGSVRANSFELVGPSARAVLAETVLDVALLGVDGVDARFGVTTADAGEAEVGRAFAAAAKQVVVVADASKFGATGPTRLLGLDGVDVLVTDRPPPGPLAAALAGAGVRLVVADGAT